MKLQLNEKTLNVYIDEAIKQEINEGGWTKLANFATRKATKAAERTAAKNAAKQGARTITHSPIAKKATGRVADARSARKFVMGLRRGKMVSGKVESGAAKDLQWFTKDGKKFFTKDASGKMVEINNKNTLGAVKGSFKSHLTHAKNLFNSAQRNMLGTATVAGLGAGWAIDHNAHKDDPWNNTTEPGDENVPDGDDNGGFDGGFPWDNTDPSWTPRRPKRTGPTADTTQEPAPVQPERPKMEPIAPVTTPLNMPTGVTGPAAPGIVRPEVQPRFPQNAVNTMINTAQESPAVASQREKNRALRQMRDNAVDAIRSDSYGADKETKKADTKFVKDAYKTIKRGDQHPSL